MRAVRLYEFGAATNLRYEEVDDPKPSPGQVRVAVHAAGVHFVDTVTRSGRQFGPYPLPELPLVLGSDAAGVVDALGADVEVDWLGRRVAAQLGPARGGYADFAVAEAAALHAVPDNLADDVAVAMVGTGRTAVGILDVADLRADDVVLVTAAAGGMGALFLQAARHTGALAVGIAGGAAKMDVIHDLGAIAVDYTDGAWLERVRTALGDREVSVVLDGVGGELGRGALDLLGYGGRIVLFGAASGTPTEVATVDIVSKGLTVSWGLGPLLKRQDGMRGLEERALAAAADGTLVPLITTFPLADAASAHSAVEDRSTLGKVVLLP